MSFGRYGTTFAIAAALWLSAVCISCPFLAEEPDDPPVGLQSLELLSGPYSLEVKWDGSRGSVNAYEPDELVALTIEAYSGNRVEFRLDQGAWKEPSEDRDQDQINLRIGVTILEVRCTHLSTDEQVLYTITILRENKLPPPEFSPTFAGLLAGDTIGITCRYTLAEIRYTTGDGSQPEPTETTGFVGGEFEFTGAVTIKARTFQEGIPGSDTAMATYRLVPSPAMLSVPGGTFNNGAADMTVSSFSIGKYEVTYELWRCVEAWARQEKDYSLRPVLKGTDGEGNEDEPVTGMSWQNAVPWCNALSERYGLTPVYYEDEAFTKPIRYHYWGDSPFFAKWDADGFRLPTETEWEYAARYVKADTFLPATYASGAEADAYDGEATGAVAWFSKNSGLHTHSVGLKEPNALGAYDMSGNVSELCWDYAAPYPTTAQTDYRGGTNSYGLHVARGGNCHFDSRYLETGIRDARESDAEEYGYGFRLSRSIP